MSDLPDLPTGQVSYVAYWNAIDDGGVAEIDAEDVLTDPGIIEYTLYDNGVTMKYQGQVGTVNARVKNDGWFVTWLDRSENFATDYIRPFGDPPYPEDDISPVSGWWNIGNAWPSPGGTTDYTQHTLERVIQSLQSQLSNSTVITYNTGDVGLYNYQYSDAEYSTFMSQGIGNGNVQPGFSYTDTTTLYAAVAFGYCSRNNNSSGGGDCSFEGVDIASINQTDPNLGVIDLLERNLIPNANTEYQGEVSANFYDASQANLDVIVLWS